MSNIEKDEEYYTNVIERLKEENCQLISELQSWKEYIHKILRLVKTFRNDYIIMQTKCLQSIEKANNQGNDENLEMGFLEFLRGKLHTIAEVINDLHIINSIKIIHDTEYGATEYKNQTNELHIKETETNNEFMREIV